MRYSELFCHGSSFDLSCFQPSDLLVKQKARGGKKFQLKPDLQLKFKL